MFQCHVSSEIHDLLCPTASTYKDALISSLLATSSTVLRSSVSPILYSLWTMAKMHLFVLHKLLSLNGLSCSQKVCSMLH